MNNSYLAHYGTPGQKWGIRRYQNEDGSLTPEGRARYLNSDGTMKKNAKTLHERDVAQYKSQKGQKISAYTLAGVSAGAGVAGLSSRRADAHGAIANFQERRAYGLRGLAKDDRRHADQTELDLETLLTAKVRRGEDIDSINQNRLVKKLQEAYALQQRSAFEREARARKADKEANTNRKVEKLLNTVGIGTGIATAAASMTGGLVASANMAAQVKKYNEGFMNAVMDLPVKDLPDKD